MTVEPTEAAREARFFEEKLYEVLGTLRNGFRTGHTPKKQRDIAKAYVDEQIKELRRRRNEYETAR